MKVARSNILKRPSFALMESYWQVHRRAFAGIGGIFLLSAAVARIWGRLRMALNCNWFICSDIGGHFPEIDDAVY